MEIKVDTTEQERILASLLAKNDAESLRMNRYLDMADLSRSEGSPLFEIVKNTREIPILKDFDNIIIPEIVSAEVSFDLFNFAPNHPVRSKSDTYYVDEKKILNLDDLKLALVEIVEGLFGKEVKYRFLDDTFPYTDPSLQIEVELDGKWVEIMGGGMPRKDVLKNFGLEGYNGWAFGFGLERLAIISMKLPDIRLLWSSDERVKKQLKLG